MPPRPLIALGLSVTALLASGCPQKSKEPAPSAAASVEHPPAADDRDNDDERDEKTEKAEKKEQGGW